MGDYEGSLQAAFLRAAPVRPSNRRPFDSQTFKAAEEGFSGWRDDLHRQAQEQMFDCERAQEAVRAADDKVKEFSSTSLDLERWKLHQAKRAEDALRTALRNFPTTRGEAFKAKNRADQALQDFMEGAYASFIYLRDRVAELENYGKCEESRWQIK